MTQRYEVKGKLGHGGLGEVYLAYDTQLDREVALKRVRPQEDTETGSKNLAADLVREAKTLSSLQHPNIVTIFDVGSDAQGPFVVMEYIKGETLDQVSERGKLSVEDFREIVLQTMEGMVAAGSMGLVHRDLKPGNIMVNWLPTGKIQLKILDFGLAKFSKTAVPQTQDQGAGIFGSIFFMAPEQFERLPLDARTDLYSLGCIFYQLLTQKHPFDGRTPVDVMVSHLQHLTTPLHDLRSDVPRWMADWVMWLISREMEQRPADARAALQHFTEGKSGIAGAVAPPPRDATGPVKPAQVPRPAAPPLPPPAPPANVAAVRARPGGHSRGRPRKVDGHVKGLPKEKLHWATALTTVLIIGAGLGGIWYIWANRNPLKEDPRAILTLLKGNAPEGDANSVDELLKLAAKDPEAAAECLEVLKKLKGQEVPRAISDRLNAAKKGPQRDMLVEAAATHPDKETIAVLTKLAGDDPDNDFRSRVLLALTKACTHADIVPLLSHAVKFQEEPVRTHYYKTIEILLSREEDRDRRVEALAPALKTAGLASQPMIYRLIGATGSPEAHKVLASEISAAGDRRRAALEALKAWNAPDISIANALLEAAKSGDRDTYTGAYARTISRVPTLSGAEVAAALRAAVPLADSPRSRSEYAAALGTLGSKEALALANELAASPDAALASAVKEQLEKIQKQNAAVVTLAKGENNLDAANAIILSAEKDAEYSAAVKHITGWRTPRTRIAWDIEVPKNTTVEIEVSQSSVLKGSSFFVTVAGKSAETDVVQTKTSDDFMRVNAGTIELYKSGSWRIWLEPGRITEKETFLNVRGLILRAK